MWVLPLIRNCRLEYLDVQDLRRWLGKLCTIMLSSLSNLSALQHCLVHSSRIVETIREWYQWDWLVKHLPTCRGRIPHYIPYGQKTTEPHTNSYVTGLSIYIFQLILELTEPPSLPLRLSTDPASEFTQTSKTIDWPWPWSLLDRNPKC